MPRHIQLHWFVGHATEVALQSLKGFHFLFLSSVDPDRTSVMTNNRACLNVLPQWCFPQLKPYTTRPWINTEKRMCHFTNIFNIKLNYFLTSFILYCIYSSTICVLSVQNTSWIKRIHVHIISKPVISELCISLNLSCQDIYVP